MKKLILALIVCLTFISNDSIGSNAHSGGGGGASFTGGALSSALSCIAGDATTPGLNFGDSGTGFYRSAVNRIDVTTNGNRKAFFTADSGTALVILDGLKLTFDTEETGSNIVSANGTNLVLHAGTGAVTLCDTTNCSNVAFEVKNSGSVINANAVDYHFGNVADTALYHEYEKQVATTDATVTTIETFATSTNHSYLLTTRIVGRRTGGTSGSAGDTAAYNLVYFVKNVAGTVTVTQQTRGETEDQAGWDAACSASSTNVVCQVTGAANNNVNWTSDTKVNVN